ncbi:AI-2E family transporter [Pelagibacterium limicola]|uniref:AI-2E family transporter n=1 Tax=Pelagibacterium limicola TaxID=2791022 RepID=UPI0018AFA711|nr:AI-2E family transporter [Pelagibacterium limicola]
MPSDNHKLPDWRWQLRLALAFAIAGVGVFLLWELSSVLLLVFGALILTAVIRGFAEIITRHTPLGERAAQVTAIIMLALGSLGFLFLLGQQIKEQFVELFEQMPDLIALVGDTFGIDDIGEALATVLTEFVDLGAFAGGIGAGVMGVVGAASAAILVVVGGIYFALELKTYRRGLISLVPLPHKDRISDALDASADGLKRWLAGQLLAMLVVGIAVTLVMMALGLPSALAIGIIAGVLEFIPFLGPILAAIPALLVAFSEGEEMVMWVLIAYVLIQQIEGNVLVPLIQKRTVRLPPALGLFSILAFGILFGAWGVVLATPLTVVVMIMVQKLYLKEASSTQ